MTRHLKPKKYVEKEEEGGNSRRKFLNIVSGTAVATAASLTLGEGPSVKAEAPSEPLEDLSSSAKDSKKKPSFQQYVTERLEELTAITAMDGPIYSQLTKVREALSALSARLDSYGNAVGDPNQIKAINETLCEIKRALGLPCP